MQEAGESFDAFLLDIRTLCKTCNYCVNGVSSMLRDRIVLGVQSNAARTDLLKERKLTLGKAVDICRTAESAATQNSMLAQPETIHKISRDKKRNPRCRSNSNSTSDWYNREDQGDSGMKGTVEARKDDRLQILLGSTRADQREVPSLGKVLQYM